MPMEGEIYTEIYRHRFIIGIGLHSYGSLPPAICKLENQEIWWCNSVRVRRPKNQESQGHKPQSKSEGLRTRANVWGQGKVKVLDKQREQFCSPSVFLFYSGPQGIGWCQSTWVRIDSVYQFICQTSSGNTLTDTPRNNILPAFWTSL